MSLDSELWVATIQHTASATFQYQTGEESIVTSDKIKILVNLI